MGLACASQKGRSSAGGVLRITRQWAAWCLAGGVQASVRWIPSERNVADAPSRRRAPLGAWLDGGAGGAEPDLDRWDVRGGSLRSQRADVAAAGAELDELA
eukprot:3459662-Pyramimonas_sp.AAC.1